MSAECQMPVLLEFPNFLEDEEVRNLDVTTIGNSVFPRQSVSSTRDGREEMLRGQQGFMSYWVLCRLQFYQ